jgi:hypothetical protein
MRSARVAEHSAPRLRSTLILSLSTLPAELGPLLIRRQFVTVQLYNRKFGKRLNGEIYQLRV